MPRRASTAPAPLPSHHCPTPSSLLPQPPTPRISFPSHRTTQTQHTPHPLQLPSRALHTTPDGLRQLETNWRERRRRRLEESLSRRRRVDRGLMRMSLSARRESQSRPVVGADDENLYELEGSVSQAEDAEGTGEVLPVLEEKTPRRGRSFRPIQPDPEQELLSHSHHPAESTSHNRPITPPPPQPRRNPLLNRFIHSQAQPQRSPDMNHAGSNLPQPSHRPLPRNPPPMRCRPERGADISRSSSVRFSLPPSLEKGEKGWVERSGEEDEVEVEEGVEEEVEEDVGEDVTESTIRPPVRSCSDFNQRRAQETRRPKETASRRRSIDLHPLPPGTYTTLISPTLFPFLRPRIHFPPTTARAGNDHSGSTSIPVQVIIYPPITNNSRADKGRTDKQDRIATLLVTPTKRIHLLSPPTSFTYVHAIRTPPPEGKAKSAGGGGVGKIRWVRETYILKDWEGWEKWVRGVWRGLEGVLGKVKEEVDRAVYNLPEGHLHISCSSPPNITFYTSFPSNSSTSQNPTYDSQTTQMTVLPPDAERNETGARAKVVFDQGKGVCKVHTIVKGRLEDEKGKAVELYRSRRTLVARGLGELKRVLRNIEKGRLEEGEAWWHEAEVRALRDFVAVSGMWVGKEF